MSDLHDTCEEGIAERDWYAARSRKVGRRDTYRVATVMINEDDE